MAEAQRVVVIGQGYVGLPLAMRAVEVGFDVVGFEIDEKRVKRLAEGDSYVEDISSAAFERGFDERSVPAQRKRRRPGVV